MSKDKLEIPRSLRARMRDVATRHQLGSPEEAALHFVTRGLDRYGVAAGPVKRRVADAVEAQGYSSGDELIEHLLLRGLRAYEEPAESPEQLAARLRGLGYID